MRENPEPFNPLIAQLHEIVIQKQQDIIQMLTDLLCCEEEIDVRKSLVFIEEEISKISKIIESFPNKMNNQEAKL